MNNLYIRFQWVLAGIRLQLGHLSSFDFLDLAATTTRVINQSGDRAMLADWCENYLIPSLNEVREWAEEVILETPKEKRQNEKST